MAVRMEARRMGLGMQLTPQEWPHWLPKEPPSPCPQYHRPRSREQAPCWVYWQTDPGNWVNQWREACEDAVLMAQFGTLPADVFKVEAGKQLIALYWGEGGEPETVQRISAVLKALA
jgi:hypothetical protein